MAPSDNSAAYQSLHSASAHSDTFTEHDLQSPAIQVVDGSYNTGKNGDYDLDEEAGPDTQDKLARNDRDGKTNNQVILTPKEEKRVADLAVLRRLMVNTGLIALWYTFSISISLVGRSRILEFG